MQLWRIRQIYWVKQFTESMIIAKFMDRACKKAERGVIERRHPDFGTLFVSCFEGNYECDIDHKFNSSSSEVG